MRFLDFRKALADFRVFSLSDIRVIDPGFDRKRLTEWQQKGYITKIIKGHYIFCDVEPDDNILIEIANRIYGPSYVSLETALAHHHLIPESVYAITSVTTRRTYAFETPVSRFFYRTLLRRLFFGYDIGPRPIKIAFVEKALLDLFYLNPNLQTEEDFESLRLDRDSLLERLDQHRFDAYLRRFAQKTLTGRMERFTRWLHDA